MGVWRSLAGTVCVEIVCADITNGLRQINQAQIVLRNIAYTGAITVQTEIAREDYKRLTAIVEKLDGKIRIVRKNGAFWALRKLVRRPVLYVGLMLLLFAALVIPGRIYFVKVEGNTTVPTKLILEKAEECGIGFGAVRRDVRSEKIKNALLSAVPELQWAGVNTSGCVATISVKEKSVSDSAPKSLSPISSIVASRDGVILDITVLQGNGVCQVGQAVKKGQLLVSGYTDVGLAIKATQAKAEIYAQTLRKLEVVTPVPASVRGDVSYEETKYSLRIGKKVIKLYKDSGISDASCVKMYSEEYLTLPGGFQLPIAIIRETQVYRHVLTEVTAQAEDYAWMSSAASEYLQEQMIAGTILNTDIQMNMNEEYCSIQATYACVEMIGIEKNEEIVQQDGQNS